MQKPALFGLEQSNRDFAQKKYWGKNQFNSSFPAALACYMGIQGFPLVYLKLNPNLTITHHQITTADLFGLPVLSSDLYFAFETAYLPYNLFIMGDVPRVDLVTMNIANTPLPLYPLEIKLTALPDEQTYMLDEKQYGCELVIRPDTIIYLVLSLATIYRYERERLHQILHPVCQNIHDWEDPLQMLNASSDLKNALNKLLSYRLEQQAPLLLQPIWKTKGKSATLADQCLDMFVWSNFAFTRLFVESINYHKPHRRISRQERTLFWVSKMLYQFAQTGQFEAHEIIDNLTYNTKNDKAFSVGGRVTHPYMASPQLTTPRVSKEALPEIILGGGQDFLSPERRLDAIIMNSPDLFER